MKKNHELSNEELMTIERIANSKIPWVFKDDYLDFLIIVENIVFATEDLLKNKFKKSSKFGCFVSEFAELKKAVDVNRLNREDADYFSDLERVTQIFKKLSSEY